MVLSEMLARPQVRTMRPTYDAGAAMLFADALASARNWLTAGTGEPTAVARA
jgi:hypothetical protein